ncbi:hypothetical protein DO97_06970 [Neosynechococcus sphagnicola sy1]|uniref:YtkA-like domain-containing protein n=1 Tax=Neosynechococcus sphagnicola sy1 TaxID=1497020 RepID=A0A098TK24_9CYAN|nr:hypothetical protein [Neosynechococcus sphagnicola]KGF72659.1 hypothetical protein DO97_06970 [Neosynechococcus sphagnicola sy1]
MRSYQTLLISVSSVGLLFLVACSSGKQTANTASSPAASPSVTASIPTNQTIGKLDADREDKDHGEARHNGQVIETGDYHLEFVPEKEDNAIHLDFYLLQDENHDPIKNAKVTAQVQLPDGSQKAIDLKYDAQDKHYTGILPETASGDYKVTILSDINGEKVNGRFSFKR